MRTYELDSHRVASCLTGRAGRRRAAGAVRWRHPALAPVVRRGRVDERPARRSGCGRRVRALVFERAPGRRPQGAGVHRRLRKRAQCRARLRRTGSRRGRRGHLVPQHDRGDQPPGLSAPAQPQHGAAGRVVARGVPGLPGRCCPGRSAWRAFPWSWPGGSIGPRSALRWRRGGSPCECGRAGLAACSDEGVCCPAARLIVRPRPGLDRVRRLRRWRRRGRHLAARRPRAAASHLAAWPRARHRR
jgi:hypothetical protein